MQPTTISDPTPNGPTAPAAAPSAAPSAAVADPAPGARGDDDRQRRRIRRRLDRGSFAVLATVSAAGRPHAAGVVYDVAGDDLYVHTMRSSRKARNIAAHPHVGVVIAVRRIPMAPPSTLQFQGRATLLAMDAPEIRSLLAAGELRAVSGHGALDEPDGCFVRITPTGLAHTYGIGVSTWAMARDPLHVGARSVRLRSTETHPEAPSAVAYG